jgi:hypothetical protein
LPYSGTFLLLRRSGLGELICKEEFMSQDRSRLVIFIALGALFLVALCVVVIIVGRLFMQPAGETAQDPNLIYTAAAQTVQAQLTQSSGEGGFPPVTVPTQTTAPVVLPTYTQAVASTNTAIPTNTPLPTNTSLRAHRHCGSHPL